MIVDEFLALVDDPRVERTRRHSLETILVISLLAVICGADRAYRTQTSQERVRLSDRVRARPYRPDDQTTAPSLFTTVPSAA
jgi:hypothetical protein